MTFQESVTVCFRKYADFNGRATRPEYWWFFLLFLFVGKRWMLLCQFYPEHRVYAGDVRSGDCGGHETAARHEPQRLVATTASCR